MYLVADIGGTTLHAGLVDDAGRLAGRRTLPAERDASVRDALARLVDAWRAMPGADGAVGVGVGFPGVVSGGRVTSAGFGKMADAAGLDWAAWGRRTLGLPVTLENDARAAAVGEWRAGAGRGCDDLVMVTLGTGIGSCPILGGVPLRGAHGLAGVMGGHLAVPGGRGRCVCGNVGCAETVASTHALPREARRQPGFADSALARADTIDFAAVFGLADDDRLARRLRDRTLGHWGAACVNLIHAYDPRRLILGGGVMASGDVIVPAVQRWVDRHACTPWGRVEVRAATLGDDAALLGLAHLAAAGTDDVDDLGCP